MARMIPPAYTGKTPLGEKELFEKLRDDADTAGWIVLHSLDVKKHQTKIEGELDMVILAPLLGVLCIEVKGCDVERREGIWIYPYETSVEGPFKQASKAMHSLRKYVVKRDCSLSGILFFSAVIFTRANFATDSPEWHSWQYINASAFRRCAISAGISEILERAHAHLRDKVGLHSWYRDKDSRPSDAQVRRIANFLRDDFEYPASPRADFEVNEARIKHFTEEQFDALDLLQDNSRVIFKGPAGTGKTFLAIESALRASRDGKSILFLCFNSLLGDWLKTEMSGISDDKRVFRCGTFHSLLIEIIGQRNVRDCQDYWQSQLPLQAIDRLLQDDRSHPIYDMLIVDEAQDITRQEYLDVLDLMLKDGLAGGQWALFGDFERQAIYSSDDVSGSCLGLQNIQCRAPNHVNYNLRINCRNAEPIAEILTITSGLVPGYKRVLQDMEGSDVDPIFYNTADHQVECLQESVNSLLKTFKAGEIVVLSMRADDASCASAASGRLPGLHLAPIRKVCDSQTIPFVSIHAFKGLEAPAVIITDVENLGDERSRSLLYVGMSRARIRLYVLMNEHCRPDYDRILDSGLQQIAKR
jgi:DNA replication protein DnaC